VTPALTAILTLLPAPPTGWTETPDDYRARVEVIAEAVTVETPSTYWAMGVLAVFWHESHFRRSVHSGEKRGDSGRAICMGQHHRNGRTRAAWESLAGTDADATRRCVRATYHTLRRAQGWCSQWGTVRAGMLSTVTAYGTGRTCAASRAAHPEWFFARAATHAWLTRRFGS